MAIHIAPRCQRCGAHYLDGTRTTCRRCLRLGKSRRRRTKIRFRCDCGRMAVTVALVKVGDPDEGLSEVRLPLCPQCLQEEQETQEILASLGFQL